MIRGVFFDFDGTLYDRDAAILRVGENQFSTFREQFPHVKQAAFLERLVALDAHGHGRVPQLHHKLAAELGFPESVADQLEAYFRAEYPKCCHATEDTVATLKTLRDRGLKLGIVTNGPSLWQSRKIEAMGIAPLFDTIVISGNEGVEKPNPLIFARALERCGVNAAESIFVGIEEDPIIFFQRQAVKLVTGR